MKMSEFLLGLVVEAGGVEDAIQVVIDNNGPKDIPLSMSTKLKYSRLAAV